MWNEHGMKPIPLLAALCLSVLFLGGCGSEEKVASASEVDKAPQGTGIEPVDKAREVAAKENAYQKDGERDVYGESR
jgi:PBP1b-binding outer membrane lipoprotein LpoB